jgi:2-oxoglutarate dehydrogenase E2 component (dihydrolipoamide succinyltransferase)
VPASASSPAALAGEQTPALELNGQPGGPPAAGNRSGAVPPSPSAQKLMAENGVANGALEGSGKHGQVLKEDVLASLARPAAAPAAPAAPVTPAAPAPATPAPVIPMVPISPAPIASLTSSAAPVAMPQTKTAEPSAAPPVPAATNAAAANPAIPTPAEPAPRPAPSIVPEPAAAAPRPPITPLQHQPAESVTAAPAPIAPAAVRAPGFAEDAAREERVKMTRLRQTIARRLKEAQNTAAMLTTFNEVDMSAVMALRNQYKDAFEGRHGVKLGFMGFFVKACIAALKAVPEVNAEIDGTDLIYKNHYDIGVAVGTERGLVVPVLRDADARSLAEIEKGIAELGAKARDGTLALDDLQGGTFTISNGGVYGSLMSTPILNQPQSGILGMHKIQDRPMAIKGQVVIRPMMYLALSYDHRVVDGQGAVTFLVKVKEYVEDPQRLLLEV